ncbi:hypothetical protein HYH02_011595 [Chlamydomonas schloesseri]|uniref:Uncharacterized protein n=1 Tax=Chlamydomonas schloesseri TaxID=2026947 RepID=A0A835T954_9CHLO|nr:hypothetical protein HYH02_011595 [Chlamydomonas schloesseri]|eukprot:KAG2436084.1 hypothetical protein HYH02_011595 [Chlamydomonas schloesseri]
MVAPVVAAALAPGQRQASEPEAGHAVAATHAAGEPDWNGGSTATSDAISVGSQQHVAPQPSHLRHFVAASTTATSGPSSSTRASTADGTSRHMADSRGISSPDMSHSGFVEVDLGEDVVLSLPAGGPAPRAGTGAVSTGDAAAARARLQHAMELTRQLRWAASWRQVRELLAAAPPGALDEVHLSTAATRLRAVAPPGQTAPASSGPAASSAAADAGNDTSRGPGPRSRRAGGGGGGRGARSAAGSSAAATTSGSRAAKRERAAFRAFVAGLTELCGPYLPHMSPAPLTGVLYALAALKCPPPAGWVESWLAAAAARMQQQQQQLLVVAAGSSTTLGQEMEVEGVVAAAAARGLAGASASGTSSSSSSSRRKGGSGNDHGESFGPQELSNCMYALGQLGFEPGDDWMQCYCAVAARFLLATGASSPLPSAIAAAAGAAPGAVGERGSGKDEHSGSSRDSRSAFTAQGLSQVAWGFARLGFVPEPGFLSLLLSAVRRALPDFTAQGLANTLWAAASLGLTPPAPWVAAAATAALRLLPTCSAYDLSVVLWALLRLGHTPGPDWVSAYLAASYRQLPSATPEQAARMLWCCAAVGLPPPGDWVRRWLGCSYVKLLEAEPAALTTMAYALAALGIRPTDRWSDMLLVAAWEAPLRSFPPPDLALLMWGLAHCRVVPEPAWMDEWWAVSYKRLRLFTPRHLSLLLWSCVTIGQAPSRQWLVGYEAVTLPAMPHMTAQGLSLLSYTYGCLERRPPRAWLAALYGAAAGVSPRCSGREALPSGGLQEEALLEAPEAEAGGRGGDVEEGDVDSSAASAYDGLARFNALGLERLLWGIAKMAPPAGSLPDDVLPGWTDAFLAAAAARLLPQHSGSGARAGAAGVGGADRTNAAFPHASSQPATVAAPHAGLADHFPLQVAGVGSAGLGGAGPDGVEEADGTYGNVANTLYALALLRVRPEAAWLLPVMDRVEALLPDFGHTTLVKVAWALPRLTSGPPTHRPFSASTAPGWSGLHPTAAAPAPLDGAGERRRLRERLATLQRLVTARMRRTIGGRRPGGVATAAATDSDAGVASDVEAADWDESLEEPGVGVPVSGVAEEVLGGHSSGGTSGDGGDHQAEAGGDARPPRRRVRRRAMLE